MKLPHILAAAVALVAPLLRAKSAEGIDAAVLIEAIADVESGNNPSVIGKLGERGRCQFRRSVWQAYTNAEFIAWAPHDCPFTRDIERRHLAWLCKELERQGHALDPALIAAAWRYGVTRAARFIRDEAAQRAANLYWDKLKSRARREAYR